jgi:hypothetical protein
MKDERHEKVTAKREERKQAREESGGRVSRMLHRDAAPDEADPPD